MSKEKEIMLRPNKDGEWEVFEPYTTIVVDTEEDYKFLEEAVEKQKAKDIHIYANGTEHCPNCDANLTGMGFKYCIECGQALSNY
jgi:hypothetical protein